MRFKVFDIGGREGQPEVVHERVLTVPNVLTAVRLAGLPLFAWLVLGPARLGQALIVLSLIAGTDWIDGFVARRFDQVSRLGKVLDPLVDRLLLATTALTLLAAGILPWWAVVLVLLRDLVLLVASIALLGRVPALAVTRTGKFATACLLLALPLFLAGAADWGGAEAAAVLGWGYYVLGVVGYYLSAAQYMREFVALRASRRAAEAG